MSQRLLTSVRLPKQVAPATPPAGTVELYAKADGHLYRRDEAGTEVDLEAAGAGGGQAPWRSKLHALWGDGNPAQHDVMWAFQNSAVSIAGPTATGIGTTVGRLVMFRFESAITAARLRWFQVAALPASTFTLAIYVGTDRVYVLDPMPAGVVGWNSVAVSLTLPADTIGWLGLSAKAVGTTTPWRTPASPIASSLGLATMPGNLALYGARFAQVALTLGAWPTILPALANAAFASGGTTGTVPIVFADQNAAA